MNRRLVLAAAASAVAVVVPVISIAGPAGAAPPSPSQPAGPELGVVPPHNQLGSPGGAGGNLSYHGGRVMLVNKVYAIYWTPANFGMQTGYDSTINSFFTNVAHDNGQTSNVYYSDTQYTNGSGSHIAYSSSLGGSYVDTAALPTSGCSDSYTSVCLTDGQIQSEIRRVVGLKGWSADQNTEVFMFTGSGIGSCYNNSSCAFSQYCAYHSNIGGTYQYANMPYAMTVPAACDSGQHPNNNDADATINVTSHEHNEAITDPLGSAWYDKRGYENGDKCAWKFGTSLGGGSGSKYNQVINGSHYYLQQEWSNYSSNCVLTGK